MGNAPSAYKVIDRSIMLPYYKRFLVEPSLPFIPVKVHPNSITHTGHLLCFVSVALLLWARPERGWLFLASMLLLQAYLWCDNADGAHARRTRQSSVFGEFLDHGLDLLNTTYIALLTTASLGSSPGMVLALGMVIPGAAAMTCWEQTETGTFQMGMLNQIESVMVLSLTMIVSSFFGTEVWRSVHLGPISAYQFFHYWPIATIVFAEARRIWRVYRAGGTVAPAFGYLAFQSAVGVAYLSGFMATHVALSLAVVATLFLGLRSLSLRLQSLKTRVEPIFVLSTAVVLAYVGARLGGIEVSQSVGLLLWAAGVAVYALSGLNEARVSVNNLSRIESR
ncbi:MAG: CDP-alcohol phosphatidyltransferase family protein [Myxococcales bacterium]|nr:CDP-alcohol phosphatidyltransferase family protein [Myxococcales bacterium]